jgi:hypothetical protein
LDRLLSDNRSAKVAFALSLAHSLVVQGARRLVCTLFVCFHCWKYLKIENVEINGDGKVGPKDRRSVSMRPDSGKREPSDVDT